MCKASGASQLMPNGVVMKLGNRMKAAFLAASMIGLSACGGSQPIDPAMFDAEVQRLADDGDIYGEIFLVLKENRPALYNEFRDIAVREFGRGRPAREASYVAGMQMREKFLSEILQLSRTAADDMIKDMIGVSIETFTHLNEEAPGDCVRSIEGLAPEKVDDYPPVLRKREMQLITDLLKAPQITANRRVASEKEITNWMFNLSTAEPDVAKMFVLMASEKRNDKDNKALCEGMITVYKRLSYKPADKAGPLFRGMALLALQQQQLNRLADAEDDAAS